MLLNLINNICSSPRTANREQSSLNFFNSFKDKFLFIRICLAFLLQSFNINLVKSFLSVFIRFSKNKFANLITRRLQPLVLTIHKKAPKCNCRQWVSQRDAEAKTHCYLTLLTSITFDSLSRKIKISCLVINFKFIISLRRKLSCIISKNFLPTWL